MRKLILIFLSFILVFTSCSQPTFESYDIYAMNTIVTLYLPKADEELCERAHRTIDSLEQIFSSTREDSEINRGGELSSEAYELLTLALEVAQNTDGAYDPTCRALTELWDITSGGYLPTEEEIASALKTVDYKKVALNDRTLTEGIGLDLGGIAKGYALEKTLQLLKSESEYGMVSFGGNVGVYGSKPDGSAWQIAVKDPFDTSSVIGCIEISEGYISVSGDYERYFEKDGVRYHHIFDPKSGYPCDNGVRSVAVYTNNGALGDALSTALFVMGYEKGIEFYRENIYDFEALFVTDEGIKMTEGMEEIFINEN